jgi:uncharacterized protein (DUF488 family)
VNYVTGRLFADGLHDFFTVGYQAYSTECLVKELNESGIELVLDVRENPFSTKHGFSRGPLEQSLLRAGIAYQHRLELGTPREIRAFYRQSGDATEALRLYDSYLESHRSVIDSLIKSMTGRKVCLLCLESDHKLCHRGVIARKVEEMTQWNPVHLKMAGSRKRPL